MSNYSTAKMLGKLGQSVVREPCLEQEDVCEAPRLVLSASPRNEKENKLKNILMHALGGPSKKFTPMDNS